MAEQKEQRTKSKKSSSNKTREKESEWQERVVQIRRVTKVVKGGKKLSFRAIVIIGNERGQVGVGVGKASDVIGAVKKGVADGKKHLIEVPLTKANSIPHPINGDRWRSQSHDASGRTRNRGNCRGSSANCSRTSRSPQHLSQTARFWKSLKQRPSSSQRPLNPPHIVRSCSRTRNSSRKPLRLGDARIGNCKF
jgi:hypothetical protein